jgi:putative CRISPR-associated protein (TIGR02619 family)
MAKIVITTVGTSLLEKTGLEKVKGWLSQKRKADIDNLLKGTAIGQQEKDKTVEEYLVKVKNLEDYPGEISSLKRMKLNKDADRVKLLFSDTPEGAFCARAIALYIQKDLAICDYSKDIKKIDDLEVKKPQSFLKGLENLISLLEKIKDEVEKEGNEIVINITGGYKGIIPFISFFAEEHQKKIYYLYQDSDLIEILPNRIVTSTDLNGNQAKKDLRPL